MLRNIALCLAGVLLVVCGSADAHHSFAAEFDGNKPVRLIGTITRIEWTNPHSYFYLDVQDSKGQVNNWACESGNPGALSRRGWKKGDIKFGDHLVVDGYLAKDGSRLIDARRVTLPDGRVVYGGSAGDGGPGDAASGAEAMRQASGYVVLAMVSVAAALSNSSAANSSAASGAADAGVGAKAAPTVPDIQPEEASLLFGVEPVGPSPSAPRTADGHPDLSGFWKGSRATKPVGNIGKDLPGFKLPLTAAGEAALKHNLTATVDPEALCIIGGIPRHSASALPFEIVQNKDRVVFLYMYTYFRAIPVDGRKHTADPDPTFFGDRTGRWEGDTFVIDTVGLKDTPIWIDENANPQSEAMHVVEKWTRPDANHVHLEMTVDDPKFYTQPFKYTRTWLAGKPGEGLKEYSCSENNVDRPHIGPGPGPIRADGTRGYDVPPLPAVPPSPEAYGK